MVHSFPTRRSSDLRQGLSLSRLHALVLVAEAGSIAAAAPGDRNRQSLLSRQLNELEGFFPVALKKVDGRSIRLTPAGRELAGLARRQLDELTNFYQRCCGLSANVSLAAGDGFLQWIVLPHFEVAPESWTAGMVKSRNTNDPASCPETSYIQSRVQSPGRA